MLSLHKQHNRAAVEEARVPSIPVCLHFALLRFLNPARVAGTMDHLFPAVLSNALPSVLFSSAGLTNASWDGTECDCGSRVQIMCFKIAAWHNTH